MLAKSKYTWSPIVCWCGAFESKVFHRYAVDGTPIVYARCGKCSTVRAGCYLNETGLFYTTDFKQLYAGKAGFTFKDRILHAIEIVRHGFPEIPAREQWRFIREVYKPETAWDYGCGRMDFSFESGLDWDHLHATDVGFEAGKALLPYDLIALSHVLEHLRDPLETLKSLKLKLTPQGHVFIEIPYFQNKTSQLEVPHIWFWTPEAFEKLAHRAGFSIVKTAIPYHFRALLKPS